MIEGTLRVDKDTLGAEKSISILSRHTVSFLALSPDKKRSLLTPFDPIQNKTFKILEKGAGLIRNHHDFIYKSINRTVTVSLFCLC